MKKKKLKLKKFDFKKVFNIKNTKTFIYSVIILGGIFVATIVLIFALYIIITAPDFNREKLYKKDATTIYALDGTEMARIGKSNLTHVTYDELPEVLIDAIIATEDSRYFQHTGLDAARFIKASLGQVFRSDSSAGGASTITMQVVKNTYTDTTSKGIKGIIRKFTDIYMSIFKLENAYTKEEILEFYTNSQWLGHDGNVNYGSISGVEQGSEYYFGKSVKDLTLAEASLLAGMFQNPVAFNPYRFPNNSRKRQTSVLNLMVRHGYITKEEKDDVLNIPIESLLREKTESKVLENQAVIDYVLKEAEKLTGKNPFLVPMKIYSTIDLKVQKMMTDLETGKSYQIPESRGDLQFAVAITDVEDGSVVAMSPGKNYQAKGLNRATTKRQPGSTAKPLFDYGPFFEYLNGSTYHMFLDEPHTYSGGGKMTNWDNKYQGIMTTRRALQVSRNIPALKAFQAVARDNPQNISDFVHGLGLDYGDTLHESTSVGGFDGTSPLELSAAYAAFGRKGYFIKPYSVTKIVFLDTDTTKEYKYKKEQVMSPQTAFMISNILQGVGGSMGIKRSGTAVAGKTGTSSIGSAARKKLGIPSSGVMDSWIVSYSPKYAVATWVGYDKLSSKHYLTMSIGNNTKAAIGRTFASKLHPSGLSFKNPGGLVHLQVELETFPPQLPSTHTPSSLIVSEYFKSGTEPVDVSTRFSTLKNPTNLVLEKSGNNINLSWDPIATPDAIDNDYLIDHFNTYYENVASKYYERRLAYNKANIGTLGYDIYLNKNGNLTHLARTNSNSFSYKNANESKYTFVVKSSYSIFKANASSGLSGTINLNGNDEIEE